MKKYNLKQATAKASKILNYNLSYSVMNQYRIKGYIVSSSTEYHKVMNRTYPVYTTQDIEKFIEVYKKLLATRDIRQVRKHKLILDR